MHILCTLATVVCVTLHCTVHPAFIHLFIYLFIYNAVKVINIHIWLSTVQGVLLLRKDNEQTGLEREQPNEQTKSNAKKGGE